MDNNEYMKQTQFQLFLGRNIPDAGKITDEMMSDFIKSEVSTRFDGFTVTDGTGSVSYTHLTLPTNREV